MAKNTKITMSNRQSFLIDQTLEQIGAKSMPHAPYHYLLNKSNGGIIWIMTKNICSMEDLR